MYKYATSISADIGRTTIRTAIVRHGGEIIADFTYPLKRPLEKNKLIKQLLRDISDTRSEAMSLKLNPLCVGIAAKGFIDYRKGVIYGPDQGIKGWENVKLAKIIGDHTGLPVYLDNDAKLMALAEYLRGAGKGYNNLVFVALRSGIGGAIIIEGKLYRGSNNAGGEIGQMSVDMFGQYSDKGIKGSLENFASSIALVKSYLMSKGHSYESQRKGSAELRARDIFELSYEDDKYAKKAVSDNASYVGAGLANLISIFSPDIIILGGGMALAKDEYLEMIRINARANSLEYCHNDVEIVRAALGHSSSLIGAGIYALTRLDGKQI